MQKVYLSVTQTGRRGFFTNRYLVIELPEPIFNRALVDEAYAARVAERMNFKYEARKNAAQ